MSRSYLVSVRDCQTRTVCAEDHVRTQLEILEVLPPEQMAGLLADELERRGYQRDGALLTRTQNGVLITVDTNTATAIVTAETSEQTTIEVERSGHAYDDVGPHTKVIKDNLKKQLEKDIDRKAEEKAASLQTKVTDRLERELNDVRQELDQVVNRVTAEALKRKAAQMGQIKEMTEDPQAGSLTIVVEV
jgi:hypothetical protein